jgi:hypothetical protein
MKNKLNKRPPAHVLCSGGRGGMGIAFKKDFVRVGALTAYNKGQALVAALLGLRHIFASAIATAKMSYAPETLKLTFLFPLFLCMLICPAQADTAPDENTAPGVSGPISDDACRTAIRASLSHSVSVMELRDRKYADRRVRYLRDQSLHAEAAISFMGAVAGGRIGVLDISNTQRRTVVNFEARAGYFARAFGAEAYYNQNGRYRITDSPYGIGALWNKTNSGAPVKTESAGLNLFLFMKDILSFNTDYSYGAAYHQTEKQGKSSGAFMLIAGADYYRLRSAVQVAPLYAEQLFMYQRLYGMKGWRFIGFYFGIGFAGTLVLPRGFYIAPLIAIAVHPYQMEFFTLTGTKRNFRIDSLKGQGRLGAGYDSGRFFVGLCINFDGIIYPCYRYKAELWNGDLNAGVFSGMRM